jgi:hypothetical protein
MSLQESQGRVRWSAMVVLAVAFGTILNIAQSAPRGTDPKTSSKTFHPRLLEIARTYESFGRVDDEFRWAPYRCRMPNPAIARFSASKEATTHGQKLYSLFAENRRAYLDVDLLSIAPIAASSAAPKKKDQPVGQVLVKQSWIPKEIPDNAKGVAPVIRRIEEPAQGKDGKAVKKVQLDHFLPFAKMDGKLYRADKKAALFIMYKLDPATPGTDRGWVYGTVTPDGKQVTSAGRVASCMKCHESAKSDRLFGLSGKK